MNKRQQILQWQQQGHIKSQDIDKSLELNEAQISPNEWYQFITKSLLFLGFVSLAVGIIFFFAYNWDNMTKMTKFVLVQLTLAVSLLSYSQLKLFSHASTALLLFSAILIGALLALFGQTYQTGKDPWELFMVWSIFVFPLAYVSKNSSLWILWLGLVNLSVYLYLNIYHRFFGLLFNDDLTVLLFAGINVLAAVLFSFLLKSSVSRQRRVAFYSAIITAMVAFTWVGFFAIMGEKYYLLYLLLYLSWMASIFYLFKVKSIDVLVLSSWSLSGIIFCLISIARLIGNSFNGGSFLFLSLVLIGLSTAATKWLMHLLKSGKGEVS
jgi:uncharacterized membrane protein